MGNKKSFRRGCESSAKFFNEPDYYFCFFCYFILTYTIQDSKSIFLHFTTTSVKMAEVLVRREREFL